MITPKCSRFAIAIAALLTGYPQISFADGFKSSEFLKWQKESQRSYFQTSIGMAGAVVAENNKKQARCFENWYVNDMVKAEKHLRGVMAKFPNYHPRGVILAVLEKQCGKIKISAR